MKNQQKNNKRSFWFRALMIILTTAVCTVSAYLICTYLITPQYHAQAFLTVDYRFIPQDDETDYFNVNESTHNIDGQRINLATVLKEYIESKETYYRAAKSASCTPQEIEDSITVANERGNHELIITANGTAARKTQTIANAYLKALDGVMKDVLAEREGKGFQSFSFFTLAPLPQSPDSPRTAFITIITGLISAIVSFIIFSGRKLFDSINILVFTAFTILCIFPFYYLFINTISDNNLVARGAINFFPLGIHFQNYLDLPNDPVIQIGNALKVTLLRTVIGTAVMVFVSAWAGYLFTRKNMWKRTFWYRAVIITMFLNSGLIPWYMNMEMLGMKGSFLAYILPGAVVPYNIILIKKHIESIPSTIEEAAIIDGAGISRKFFSIMLPMCSPILIAVTFFGVLSNWNSFYDSLLLMAEKPELQTLQHYLYRFINSAEEKAQAVNAFTTAPGRKASIQLYTLSVISFLPIFLIYPFMNRFLTKGLIFTDMKY